MASKLERELEEILKAAGDLPPAPKVRAPIVFRQRGAALPSSAPAPMRWWRGLSGASQLMLGAIVLLLASVAMGVQNPTFGAVLGMAGLLCFIASLVAARRGPRSIGTDKRWRGRVIDDNPFNRGGRR